MYKFVKIATKSNPSDGKWYFVPQTIEQVVEHSEKFLKPRLQNGFDMASHKMVQSFWKHGDIDFHDHFTDDVESAISELTRIRGFKEMPLALFDTANNMYLEAVQQRIRQLYDGRPLYLANGVQNVGLIADRDEIVDEIEKETLEYPDEQKPDIRDARYIQWPGGWHWYVKVGLNDVVDKNGNQKWNTKEEAEEATMWFCKNY